MDLKHKDVTILCFWTCTHCLLFMNILIFGPLFFQLLFVEMQTIPLTQKQWTKCLCFSPTTQIMLYDTLSTSFIKRLLIISHCPGIYALTRNNTYTSQLVLEYYLSRLILQTKWIHKEIFKDLHQVHHFYISTCSNNWWPCICDGPSALSWYQNWLHFVLLICAQSDRICNQPVVLNIFHLHFKSLLIIYQCSCPSIFIQVSHTQYQWRSCKC